MRFFQNKKTLLQKFIMIIKINSEVESCSQSLYGCDRSLYLHHIHQKVCEQVKGDMTWI